MIQRTSEKSSNLPARSYKVRLRPAKERTAQVHLAVSYAMRVRMTLSMYLKNVHKHARTFPQPTPRLEGCIQKHWLGGFSEHERKSEVVEMKGGQASPDSLKITP
jgi:hypothetical protein